MEKAIHTAPAQWWHTLYDGLLADVLLEREPGEVDETLRFLVDALQLRPGQRVFDQCCQLLRAGFLPAHFDGNLFQTEVMCV